MIKNHTHKPTRHCGLSLQSIGLLATGEIPARAALGQNDALFSDVMVSLPNHDSASLGLAHADLEKSPRPFVKGEKK